ncbi:MAG: hypothetical protein P8020_09360 [Acidobacteriota bacterium]|jgi:hypothetical protein
MLRRVLSRHCLTTLLVLLSLGLQGHAQDAQSGDEWRLDLDFGYRWKVLQHGSEDLYRSQVNLREGPSLFSGRFFYAPAPGKSRLLDRMELNLNNLGDEPYKSGQFRIAKNGKYEFSLNFLDADYFSSIPRFANPFFESGDFISEHRQDTALRNVGFELRLLPGTTFSPQIAYQRTTRSGEVHTTLRTGNDEYRLHENLNVSSDDVRVGILISARQLSLLFEQGGRWYHDLSPFTISGPEQGNSTTPMIGQQLFMDSYSAHQDVNSRVIPYATARLTYVPLPTLKVEARLSHSQADFRTNYLENMTGNFFSFPTLRAFYTGLESDSSGRFKTPNLLADLSAEWQALPRLTFVEHYRARRSHISGSGLTSDLYANADFLGAKPNQTQFELESLVESILGQDFDRQQVEARFMLTPRLMLRGGHRYERRQFDFNLDTLEGPEQPPPPFTTRGNFELKRNVAIVGGSYRLSARNRLAIDYEHGWADHPIFRTDVTDFDRLKIQGRISPTEQLEFTGIVTLFDNQDDVVDFTSENRNYSLQFSYRPKDWFGVSGEWDRSNYNTSIPYRVPQDFTIAISEFRELSNYGSLFIDLTLVRNSTLSVGYSVWGNSGTFPVNFHQPVARLEIPIGERFSVYGQWNYYDYNEKVMLFPQDYRAHLAILGFRVHLEK